MHRCVTIADKLLLSIFPGIDLLGKAFEEAGFCVVRGPDTITGGDIRNFHPAKNKFDGVFGGPPCQDFSKLNRNPGEYSREMTSEFIRVINLSCPEWFLYENVATAPSFQIRDYTTQRFNLDLAWFSHFSRNRSFIFGSRSGKLLNPMQGERREIQGTCVTGSDDRSFQSCCEIQGLPGDFELPDFHQSAKKKVVANGVPLQMGKYIAQLIANEIYGNSLTHNINDQFRRCKCGCGCVVTGRQHYASSTCRKRASRKRLKEE